LSSHGDEAQRVRQAAPAWCHDGGHTTAFTVVRSGSLTTAFALDLRKRAIADTRGPLPAALAVRGLMTDVKVLPIDRLTNLPGQCN
jgi:hypothetical protein